MRGFWGAWRTRLRALDFDRLSQEGKIDYVLLDNHLRYQLDPADRADVKRAEIAPLLPFADALLAMHDQRRDLASTPPATVARRVSAIARQVDSLRALIEPAPRNADTAAAPRGRGTAPRVSRTVANRAAERHRRHPRHTGAVVSLQQRLRPAVHLVAARPVCEAHRRDGEVRRHDPRATCGHPAHHREHRARWRQRAGRSEREHRPDHR